MRSKKFIKPTFFSCIAELLLVSMVVALLACATTTEHPTIATLHQRIASANLGSHQVTSTYRSGKLTLKGFVANEHDKRTVETLASSTPGVSRVENQLEMIPSTAHSPLVAKIRRALRTDIKPTLYDIEIKENPKAVILTGVVSSEEVGRQIIHVISNTPGVTIIQNQMRITNLLPTDKEIEQNVATALSKEFSIDNSDVRVFVREGNVTLSGSLHSQRQIDKVLSHTLMQSGVVSVNSELTIGGMPYKTGASKTS